MSGRIRNFKKEKIHLKRFRSYNISTVLEKVGEPIAHFDDHPVRMTGDRYRIFKNSTNCCECGRKGSFFALEKEIGQLTQFWHFNLYAVTEDLKEIKIITDQNKTICEQCYHPNGGSFEQLRKDCNLTKSEMVLVEKSMLQTKNLIFRSIFKQSTWTLPELQQKLHEIQLPEVTKAMHLIKGKHNA
jgi:hypothetical protein